MIRAPRPLPPGIKRRLLAAADHGLGVASIGDFYARATGARGAVILMYHSVAASERRWLQDPSMAMPASKFAAQMSFLARRRRVISLTALAETLARGNAPERGTVVITFDDGYLDNYRVAAPILARHDFPATIFLATGYIERVENMWIDTIYHAFARRTRDAFEIVGRAFDLSNSSELDRAYAETAGVLVRARVPERAAILSSILEQLRPSGQPPRLTMSWDDVRALRKSYPGISIGSHTREHVNLSNMPDAEVVGELDAAHADIRRELDIDVVHFTFPYGRDNKRASAWLESHGYLSASLTEPMSPANVGSDRLALTRLEARHDESSARLAYHTSGAYPSLSRALFLGHG